MDAERLKKIEALYNAVLDIAPDEREDFLKDHCGDDADLRREVESLLSFENNSESFLDTLPESLAAEMFFAGEKPASLAGKEISHYKVEKLLGKGGMGEVYLAGDTKLNRQVAIKVLPAELIEKRDRLRRFELEAKSASALNHPNILTIHEFGDENDLHYIVMEFVNGTSLAEKMAQGELTLGETLDIAAQVASALAQAHEAGIVHRDIKPDNIMIRRDGFVKVLDFGLAKLIENSPPPLNNASYEDPTKTLVRTDLGVVMGTAPYMSPEQARGIKIDTRTDIWSLGVVLYEMLTGQKPFAGETHADIITKVLSYEPPPISSFGRDFPAELDWIVSKALSKDVEARYQTARELRADLEKIRKRLELDESINRLAETAPRQILTKEEKALSTVSSGIDDNVPQSRLNKFRYPIYALVLLALVSATYLAFVSFKNKRSIDSIAVLPFENSTRNVDMNFVSDGLSEALIDQLSQLPQLKVIARNSSFAFRGNNSDLREIASKLDVRAVVTGNVTQIGDELIIRIDVVDAVENTHLTGGQFRRKVGDLLTIQNEIAGMIAGKLELKLTSSQTKRIAENGTENSEAYRYYLSGLVELNGPLDIRSRALEYFERAVALDPDFAAAHTEIAWIYWSQANGSGDPRILMPKVKAATERALAIDPELAKAHVLKALTNEYEFDWQAAESEYRRAIELSPNHDFARNNYAFFLSVMGRQDEALAELEQQRVRDPLNRRLNLLQKGIILTQARKFDEALQAYRDAQTIEPNKEVPQFSLGYAYGGKGLFAEAAEAYKKSVETLGGEQKYSQSLVYLAATYARIPEKQGEARAILTRIETMGDYKSPALLAIVYAALGDQDKAIELLERAYIERDLLLRFIGTGYEYDALRSDPRFTDLMKRTGLKK